MLPESPVKVLVIGGGGREHALCWKLAGSALVEKLFCAPGNGGTAALPGTENIDIAVNEFDRLTDFAKMNAVDLTVVGPDNPLADGIVDHFHNRGLRAFGPTRKAAKLEWSKAYAKEFMQQIGLPTARFVICESLAEGERLLAANPWARVVKVDGLALGKGVYVCDSHEEALSALSEIFTDNRFGSSGSKVILEEKLAGEEISLLCFCDGKRLVAMPPCQDHKRRFDGDTGPNTGGMGAYSPVALYDLCAGAISSAVLAPLERALSEGKLVYQGVLYIGLMVASNAADNTGRANYQPYVLEFNARFGDPETQAILPRLESDLLPVLWACTEGALDKVALKWSPLSSCCVVAVAESYPQSSSKGEKIEIGAVPDGSLLFHSGTALRGGQLETAGGRIICSTGLAPSMEAATSKAYQALGSVSFAGMAFRSDIARRAAGRCLST
jgi:phosphoribosylamine--glycine ligase